MNRFRSVRWSAPLLVLANAFPLFGVFWLGWDTFEVMFLFWFENLVFGACSLLRIAAACGDRNPVYHWTKPVAMLGFAFPFGIFLIAHGQMTLTLLGEEKLGWRPGEWGPDFFGPPFYALRQLWPELGYSCVAVMASHGASFLLNDLMGGGFQRTRVEEAMRLPYDRMVVPHLVMVFGVLAIEVAGSAAGLLALLVVVKTAADLRAHLRQHRLPEAAVGDAA